jgi:hypothetical protein
MMPPPDAAAEPAAGGTTIAARADDVSHVRWLARRVLARGLAGVSHQTPAPLVLSAHVTRSATARDYTLWWVRHPERGGTFDTRTRGLRLLPGTVVLRLLFALGYDGLLYERDGRIVGHVFFQRHGAALHAFSTAVDGTPEAAGFSVVMLLDFLAYASERPKIARARIGRGNNNTTRRLLERVRAYGDALGWRVDDDGWISFQR